MRDAYNRVRAVEREEVKKQNGGDEMYRLRDIGSDADTEAMYALFEVVPTTAAGAAAKLAFIIADGEADGFAGDCLENPPHAFSLLRSMETCCRNLAR